MEKVQVLDVILKNNLIFFVLQLSLAITSPTYTAPKWFRNLDLCLVKMNKWKFTYSKATS